ncbi:MAG: hypothetical protein JNL36_01920 [Candidatus Kapabacteria bacterium]|nr:hypothetical protein [Candidatus Kapabacteria bacterium]
MKTQIYLLVLVLLLAISCNDTIVDPKDNKPDDSTTYYPDCKNFVPSDLTFPESVDLYSVSYDGINASILSKSYTYFDNLNLTTGIVSRIEFDKAKFQNIKNISMYSNRKFCPYNSNLVVFSAKVQKDTIGDGKNYIVTDEIVLHDIISNEIKLITPKSFGDITSGILSIEWVGTSKQDSNVFFISRSSTNRSFFHLETETLLSDNSIIGKYSKNFEYKVHTISRNNKSFYLNDKMISLQDTINYLNIVNIDFSFDNRYVMFTVIPQETEGFVLQDSNARGRELWIMEVEKLRTSSGVFTEITKINTGYRHCLFIYDKTALLTPMNTIIASMHYHDNLKGNVYEMDLKGNILRKITNN